MDDTWRLAAACTTADPTLFFGDPDQREQAKAICRRCPAQRPCLEHAQTMPFAVGVWGGRYFDHHQPTTTPVSQPQPIRHGTEGGCRTHYRRGETPCPACADAGRIAQASRRVS